ncbi:MAG TPA: glycosyltransferase family 87 protein [Ktedonobacterales bacterium]|jgi:alpha-1,2-mannosyltransferase|nr:glycosyltransferase family 87 protein [Ktedonobacterales bacterium]
MLETAASHRQIRARIVVSLIAVVISAVTLIAWVLRVASMLRGGGRYDFSTYYAAAWALRYDIHANIYDASVLAQAGAVAHTFVSPPLPYTYPPLFAILLSPFTVLPFKTLAALWLVFNCALWLAVAVVLAREIALLLGSRIHLSDGETGEKRTLAAVLANPIPLVALALALLLCLPSEPAIQTALTGQINLLVLLPLALVPELERRGHLRWVGAMIAIAAMLKFTPAILLLYFVLRRRWQVVFFGLAVLAGLVLLCVVVVGPGVALASVGQALHVGTSDASLGHNEALLGPLIGALSTTFPGAQSFLRALEYVVLVALALAVGFVLWRRWHPVRDAVADQEKDAAGYGMALCAMVILWPTVWVHHYVWALPAAAVALALAALWIARHRGVGRIALPLFTVLCCYLLVVTLPYQWDTTASPAMTTYLGLPLRPLLLSLRALGTLGILGLLCYWYSAPATIDATSSPESRDMLGRQGSSGG